MDKLDKRTIKIIEKILRVLENSGENMNWKNETDNIEKKEYLLN